MTDPVDLSQGFVTVCLKEYDALASANADTIKRIETVRGLYITAVLGIVVAIFKLAPEDIPAELARIESSPYLLTAVLLIPLLNSLLLIYVASSMHFILAAAKYRTYVIAPRLEEQMREQVLQFDRWSCDDKSAWLALRSFSGTGFYLLASAISVAVLWRFAAAGRLLNHRPFAEGVFPGLTYILSTFVVGFSLAVGLVHLIISKRFHAHEEGTRLRPARLYWLFIPIGASLYFVFTLR